MATDTQAVKPATNGEAKQWRKYSRDNLEQLAFDLRLVKDRYVRQRGRAFRVEVTDDDFQECYLWLLKKIDERKEVRWNTHYLLLKLRGTTLDRMNRDGKFQAKCDVMPLENFPDNIVDHSDFAPGKESGGNDVRILLEEFIKRNYSYDDEELEFAMSVLNFFDDNRYAISDGDVTDEVVGSKRKTEFFLATGYDRRKWWGKYSRLVMGFRAFMMRIFEKQLESNRKLKAKSNEVKRQGPEKS